MYTEYWGLERKPFENAPDAEFFYHAPEHALALDGLRGLIRDRRGAALLTGAYGCGKTTTIQALIADLELDQQTVARLDYPRLAAKELAGEILRRLGAAPEVPAEDSQRLGERLLHTSREGGHTLVIVDEGHFIPDDDVLVELGRLIDLSLDGAPMATFLLVGEPSLADRIHRLPGLDRMVDLRHHIPALDHDQTRSYIAYRLDVAGASRVLFTEKAMGLVYEWSGGMPRQINSVCDMSLFIGARRTAQAVDEEIVRMVA
jgi:general secretion pathway protein A